MTDPGRRTPNRRTFLKAAASTAAVAAAGAAAYWVGSRKPAPKSIGKKVIVIGIDGMDPRLCAAMMEAGELPHLAKLRDAGGFSPLGTSIPPQSPVAWANFINGAGPGSHGIFDFIHRHPHEQCKPFYAASETVEGRPLLRRQGVPFWDYLDAAGIPTTFYDLPSNYPASPSQHGHHRCICGMGTPDMLGTFGTYQFFSDGDAPEAAPGESGKRVKLSFEAETARVRIVGPEYSFPNGSRPLAVEFLIHRDSQANAAVIEFPDRKVILKAGQWSRWTELSFETPWYTPNVAGIWNGSGIWNVAGICRFYLQEVAPSFRLYVSPINMDPAAPWLPISEPASFITDVSRRLGPFYTTGFQEDYNARKNNVFDDDEYLRQATMVLEERLALFEYAVDDYDDGLLFFYFSSSDLQSHMFWWEWDRAGPSFHPSRDDGAVWKNFDRIRALYTRLDRVVGELADRFGSKATILVMSDHGFANFGRQFNLNSWLRDYGYLAQCSSIMHDVDWSLTKAYGLGINGLYLNLKGRERDGIVEPGEEAESLLAELKERLEVVTDADGRPVIRSVYRASEVYSGTATALAPDLIVGYSRGYRASWETCLGDLEPEYLSDNKLAWSADHCADALEVPGVLFSSRPFRAQSPSLVDVAPSILAEFGLPAPSSMTGKSIFL
jgi:predicted AlkP superfamily phosphohydrolase/phosphomutase